MTACLVDEHLRDLRPPTPPTDYRYRPVVTTCSMSRRFPGDSPVNGLTYTIRSPFLPAIFVQSLGLLVLGRSSFFP